MSSSPWRALWQSMISVLLFFKVIKRSGSPGKMPTLTNDQKAVIQNDLEEKGWSAYAIWKEHPSFNGLKTDVVNLVNNIKEMGTYHRKRVAVDRLPWLHQKMKKKLRKMGGQLRHSVDKLSCVRALRWKFTYAVCSKCYGTKMNVSACDILEHVSVCLSCQ